MIEAVSNDGKQCVSTKQAKGKQVLQSSFNTDYPLCYSDRVRMHWVGECKRCNCIGEKWASIAFVIAFIIALNSYNNGKDSANTTHSSVVTAANSAYLTISRDSSIAIWSYWGGCCVLWLDVMRKAYLLCTQYGALPWLLIATFHLSEEVRTSHKLVDTDRLKSFTQV